MTQEQIILDLIRALGAERDPDSISPDRLAGILEAILGQSISQGADIEERLREALALKNLKVEYLTAQEAIEIVQSIFT